MYKFRLAAPLHHEPHPRLQSIEVATSVQIPSFHIVGLPSREVDEARERVRAAIEASSLEFPRRRVVLNLSPAHIRKQGTSLDLAMALAVLSAPIKKSKKSPSETKNTNLVFTLVASGELGLDGTVKPTGQITRTLYAAWEEGAPYVIIHGDEMKLGIDRIKLITKSNLFSGKEPPILIPVSNLKEAWNKFLALMEGARENAGVPLREIDLPPESNSDSLQTGSNEDSQILPILNPAFERILGVASAGCHHLLLLGPKGTGKSQMLESFTALQPLPSPDLHLKQILLSEINPLSINFSVCTQQGSDSADKLDPPQRIVRRVSSHVRPSALIGAVNALSIRPGEFSLAHGGVLIADELPEWPRDSRESLREPLERGTITLTRSRASVELPAQFTLAGSGNFCPCGGWPPSIPIPTHSELEFGGQTLCQCSALERKKYLSKLSGPILDRVDILFLMGAIKLENAKQSAQLEQWGQLKKKVKNVRENLIKNWGSPSGQLEAYKLEDLLKKVTTLKNLSPLQKAETLRSRHKILRLALSLAAWDGLIEPTEAHLMEASFFRPEHFGLNR